MTEPKGITMRTLGRLLRAALVFAMPTLLIALCAASARADSLTLYATTFSEDQLLQINLSTGVGTLVGVIPGVPGAVGPSTDDLASYGGNLYSLDHYGGSFDLLNPATAGIISSTSGVVTQGEGGFTFDASGDAFVSISQGGTGQLFKCNVTVNNGCTAIDAYQTLSPSMDGLAVNGSGVLYGMSQSPLPDSSPSLYTINESTGIATLIGATDETGNNLGGLAFDPLNGVLYSAFDGDLYTINTSNGSASLVGAIGYTDISGLAFLSSSVPTTTPEPGTASTLLLGLSGLGLLVTVKRYRGNRLASKA